MNPNDAFTKMIWLVVSILVLGTATEFWLIASFVPAA